jgi:predicted acetyltransferase
MNKPLQLTLVTPENAAAFYTQVQAYEAEFADITNKLPNAQGFFTLDVDPFLMTEATGYLFYKAEALVGFCVLTLTPSLNDVAEFYIVPAFRRQGLGVQAATHLFKRFTGQWQVRQLLQAKAATRFWQTVIKHYTNNHYSEAIVEDPHWGSVVQQRFTEPAALSTCRIRQI